ncbi:endoglucanase [Vigna unguiculata]|uniref:Endoglucanase n=1 Tax=Vigna unguiculata TaxID=3917 RepID=A0A4D6ML08_VIGUN|nr:endoglucanase [Vigna unguiculata]
MREEKEKKHMAILEEYRSKAEYYICSCLNKNNDSKDNVERTPGGLLYIREWNNMQYVSTAAFLLSTYSDFLENTNEKLNCETGTVDHEEIHSFAKSQVDYILGSNPVNMSYLVGYGPKYPKRVHHRGASIVSYKRNKGFIGCTQGYDNWYGSQEPNPNVLVGALVGGPDGKDNFEDRRNNFMQTEACTYNTAPLVGVFAKGDELVEDSLRSGGKIEGDFRTLKWRLESDLGPLITKRLVVVECEDGVANEDVCVGDGEEELADKENGVGNEEVCVRDGEEALADKFFKTGYQLETPAPNWVLYD